MKILSGKEEIVVLLKKVLEKFEAESGHTVVRNSNRKNYEEVAKTLSIISNELPNTWQTLQHEKYTIDYNPNKQDYPFRKYDITGNQVKDAYFNQIVSNPRPHLIDACYIYLYGVGKKGFEANPIDDDLIDDGSGTVLDEPTHLLQKIASLQQQLDASKTEQATALNSNTHSYQSTRRKLVISLLCVLMALGIIGFYYIKLCNSWNSIQKDMNLLPYRPTQQEIDSLEGIWLCYTGSPQARISDTNRFHKVVPNIVDVRYKNGYFTFTRYGASFDHIGYMQFDGPGLVSIHSYAKKGDSIVSPRHSLMQLNEQSPISVISASWNFDVGNKNNIIGIREVYIKQGKSGKVEEVINTIENAACKCKILRWERGSNDVQTYFLRNEQLDSLKDEELKKLIDEKSILPRVPQNGLLMQPDSIGVK